MLLRVHIVSTEQQHGMLNDILSELKEADIDTEDLNIEFSSTKVPRQGSETAVRIFPDNDEQFTHAENIAKALNSADRNIEATVT